MAAELSRMSPNVRSALGLSAELIVCVDVIITAIRILVDVEDRRPWSEKLESLSGVVEGIDQQRVDEFIAGLQHLESDGTQDLLKKLKSDDYRRFVQKLIGAARFDRLKQALQLDGAFIIVGVRRAIRHFLPLAAALDDCLSALSPEQISSIEGANDLGPSLLRAVVLIDSTLDGALGLGLPVEHVPTRPGELDLISDDVEALLVQLRDVVAGLSRTALLQLSGNLSRKVKGARDVLDVSDDGVSQAANSLIEFIDRLLRDSFNEELVIDWVNDWRKNPTDLFYTDRNGRVRPTKKAQALCFVYGGRPIDGVSVFHELTALSLAQARSELQRLKHADLGRPEEIAEIRRLISVVEGFIVFAVQVGWSGADDDWLEGLRGRLVCK